MVIEWAKAANAVYNFISLMMTDEISAGKSSIKNAFSERVHRYKIKRYCRNFFRRNYGTVISNPVFYQWIQNDGTIDRLFKHTGTTHADITDLFDELQSIFADFIMNVCNTFMMRMV